MAELRNVATGGSTVCGFKVAHAGSKVSLHQCRSKDRVPYVRDAAGEMTCEGCEADKESGGMRIKKKMLKQVKSLTRLPRTRFST